MGPGIRDNLKKRLLSLSEYEGQFPSIRKSSVEEGGSFGGKKLSIS